ncbi:MAG: AAA family ATPase [Magnetococcus sp. WYHC-3]
MHISKVILQNFRCFNDTPTEVRLEENLTVFVGTNGSGKTAAMHAMLRLFGITREQRAITRRDFHFAPSGEPSAATEKRLVLEAILEFPELSIGEEASRTVPEFFNHMCIEAEGSPPVCRVRLEAKMTDDGTPEGAIEEHIYWVHTLENVDFGDEIEQKQRMKPSQRGAIQVHYVPATRDGTALTRNALSHMSTRLIKAISWGEAAKQSINDLSEGSQSAFESEQAINRITDQLTTLWKELHPSDYDTKPRLSLLSRDFDEIIKMITFSFEPTEDHRERSLDDLSDGQKSLFYLALSAMVFEVEQKALEQSLLGKESGFLPGKLHGPALTIFALEEPENHLAPFFLSRIVRHLRQLVKSPNAMAVFSSHSPGVLGRIQPEEVRHFRLESSSRTTIVSPIALPNDDAEAAKFVREAVIAYPELYFARFVILGEGDSEQIVLPKLAEAMGLFLDPSFVAVVPLGGRHVNHFWRLLSQLGIPYCTLLDLDLGRKDGGLGRLKDAIRKLRENGIIPENEWTPEWQNWIDGGDLPTWNESDLDVIDQCCQWIEGKGVFYSCPLDLDMLMLKAFPEKYQHLHVGERGPGSDPSLIPAACETVLGSNGYGKKAYEGKLQDCLPLMPWYRYRFKSKSKPVAHIHALSRMEPGDLAAGCPDVLQRMLLWVRDSVESGGQ